MKLDKLKIVNKILAMVEEGNHDRALSEIAEIENEKLDLEIKKILYSVKAYAIDSKNNLDLEIPALSFLSESKLDCAQYKKTSDRVSDFYIHAKNLSDYENYFISNEEGITVVSVSMNRTDNLLKALPSWLNLRVNEIVIVDWSSEGELYHAIESIMKNDVRVKLIRVDNEQNWVLSHAFNVGLRLASFNKIFKFDSDIVVSDDFIEKNMFNPGEFIRGYWKHGAILGEEQKFINGSFGAYHEDLKKIGYYDERIQSYGWDDSDLYSRLVNEAGLVNKFLEPKSLLHQEQETDSRIKYQSVDKNKFLDRFDQTERLNLINKFSTAINGDWNSLKNKQDYLFCTKNTNYIIGKRITLKENSLSTIQKSSKVFAAKQLMEWTAGDFSHIPSNAFKDLYLAEFITCLEDAYSSTQSKNFLSDAKNIIIFKLGDENISYQSIIDTYKSYTKDSPVTINKIILISNGKERNSISKLDNGFYAIGEDLYNLFSIQYSYQSFSFDQNSLLELINPKENTLAILNLNNSNLFESIDTARLGIKKNLKIVPYAASDLTISLYDEKNLLRIFEYLTCLLINIEIFDHIRILYELKTGFFVRFFYQAAEYFCIDVKKVSFNLIEDRPKFDDMFSYSHSLHDRLFVVANADIFFDESLLKITKKYADKKFICLSRRDYSVENGVGPLITYENSAPNLLSADAWIVSGPFESDFSLNYEVGTIHCDSYIFNNAFKSTKYSVQNPCLSVNCYHFHNAFFNSSDEKAIVKKEEINEKLIFETNANNGINPICGCSWSSLSDDFTISNFSEREYWKPKTIFIKIDPKNYNFSTIILILFIAFSIERLDDINITLIFSEECNKNIFYKTISLIKQKLKISIINFKVDEKIISTPEVNGVKYIELSKKLSKLNNFTTQNLGDKIAHYLHLYPDEGYKMLHAHIDANSIQYFDCLEILKNDDSLFEIISSLEDLGNEFSQHFINLRPCISDVKFYKNSNNNKYNNKISVYSPKISLITSLYKAENYLPSFLNNLVDVATYSEGEIILIDVNKDSRDEEIIQTFIHNNTDLNKIFKYIHLGSDPGLYGAWEYAVNISSANLISNANVDDKRSPFHGRVMVDLLSAKSKYSAACSNIFASKYGPYESWDSIIEGDSWFHYLPEREIKFENLYHKNEEGIVISHNILHCLPVWRKNLHEKYGFWNEEKYGTSADWAFWLKCAQNGEIFYHSDKIYGRYFINNKSHNRANDVDGSKELKIINEYIDAKQRNVKKQ